MLPHAPLRFFAVFLLLIAAGLAPRVAAGQEQAAPELEGAWAGDIEVPGQSLKVIFHLARGGGDTLTATMDVPQQGAQGLPVSNAQAVGDSLRLIVAQIGGTFEGVRAGDGAIRGTWRQGGGAFPLVLEKGTPETSEVPPRPQEPEPPFPYESEEVRFPGGAEDVTLAGTLTLPEGEGPHPAVVLLSGSGLQNRNAEVFGHKLFLVLADYLTRQGIAVLRYDERSVGASTGAPAGLTMEDFAADARAALTYLRGREDLALGKLGFVGHSEGGAVAPMVATQRAPEEAAADFLVLVAGPGVPLREIVPEQTARLTAAQGASPEQVEQARAQQKRLLDAATRAADSAGAAARVRDVLREGGATEAQIESAVSQLTRAYVRRSFAYDPAPALRQIDVPVLALFGEKDFQVPPTQNAPVFRKALAGNPDATVRVLPGLNHLLQTADTGLLDEYSQIEETMAPKALALIADWILEHARGDGSGGRSQQ